MDQLLIIDQGTHATRCALFTVDGRLVDIVTHPVSLYRQSATNIEQNPEQILASIYFCLDQLRQQHDFNRVISAGLVTQRSTIVGWQHHTGKVLSPAISWQDTRGAERLQQLQVSAQQLHAITGLPLSAHYGASKIQWLLENDSHCQAASLEHELVIAPLASYLVAQLTGELIPVIDHVNAQRTQLLDLSELDWSSALLHQFGIARHCLPRVKPCLSDYGLLRHSPIPLKLVTGDQNAALFAQGELLQDMLMINLGSGGFVIRPVTQRIAEQSLLDGIAVSDEQHVQFLQEGTVNGAGLALATLFDEIEETQLFKQLPGWLEQIQSPPVFINSIAGLGSPLWRSDIQPHFLNSDAGSLPLSERAVAIIESIVFLLQMNIEAMQCSERQQIIISGGLSQLDGLCQKLADLSQLVVKQTDQSEASAQGAAWLLSQNHDHWQKPRHTIFTPTANTTLNQRYHSFSQALDSLIGNPMEIRQDQLK